MGDANFKLRARFAVICEKMRFFDDNNVFKKIVLTELCDRYSLSVDKSWPIIARDLWEKFGSLDGEMEERDLQALEILLL